jgi:hypothetical protein
MSANGVRNNFPAFNNAIASANGLEPQVDNPVQPAPVPENIMDQAIDRLMGAGYAQSLRDGTYAVQPNGPANPNNRSSNR